MREQPGDRVDEADGRVVERRLVPLGQEPAHRVGHRVGEEENREHGKDQVPNGVVDEPWAGRDRAEPLDLLGTDEPDERVDRREQHHQGGDDAGDKTEEGLASGLEEIGEPLGGLGEGAEEASGLLDGRWSGCWHDVCDSVQGGHWSSF
jgi:hypothetical protein